MPSAIHSSWVHLSCPCGTNEHAPIPQLTQRLNTALGHGDFRFYGETLVNGTNILHTFFPYRAQRYGETELAYVSSFKRIFDGVLNHNNGTFQHGQNFSDLFTLYAVTGAHNLTFITPSIHSLAQPVLPQAHYSRNDDSVCSGQHQFPDLQNPDRQNGTAMARPGQVTQTPVATTQNKMEIKDEDLSDLYDDFDDESGVNDDDNNNGKGLGGAVSSDPNAFESKRRLKPAEVTRRTMEDLMNLMESPYLDLEPHHQREVVWSASQMCGLIDSLIENYYVPPVLFNLNRIQLLDGSNRSKYVCVDGKQRLSSVKAFMQGEIGCHDKHGKIWFYKHCPEIKRKRGRFVLSDDIREEFRQKEFVCYEFDNLEEDQEEDLFARVQKGTTLTIAEKLRATSGPWQTQARLFEEDFPQVLNLVKGPSANRSGNFRHALCCFVQILEVQHPASGSGTPNLHITPTQLQTFTKNQKILNNRTRSHLAKVFGKFKELVERDLQTFENNNYTRVKTFAPIELILVAVLISEHCDNRNDQLLLGDIREMRLHLRETWSDLQTNNRVWATGYNFIDQLEAFRGAVDGSTSINPKFKAKDTQAPLQGFGQPQPQQQQQQGVNPAPSQAPHTAATAPLQPITAPPSNSDKNVSNPPEQTKHGPGASSHSPALPGSNIRTAEQGSKVVTVDQTLPAQQHDKPTAYVIDSDSENDDPAVTVPNGSGPVLRSLSLHSSPSVSTRDGQRSTGAHESVEPPLLRASLSGNIPRNDIPTASAIAANSSVPRQANAAPTGTNISPVPTSKVPNETGRAPTAPMLPAPQTSSRPTASPVVDLTLDDDDEPMDPEQERTRLLATFRGAKGVTKNPRPTPGPQPGPQQHQLPPRPVNDATTPTLRRASLAVPPKSLLGSVSTPQTPTRSGSAGNLKRKGSVLNDNGKRSKKNR